MAIITEIQEEEEEASTKTYDVFLSFRGADTRLNFTDHLYQALLNENISTFLDEEEVETGEELKPELAKAIKTSHASIIVLSKNYATSTWCLDELVMILEQRKSSDHFILPIFYHVEPTHVRKQEGSFGDALFEHRKRMENEKDDEKRTQGFRKLELWTEALTQVADVKGKDVNGRRETVFIEEIVREISSKLDLHLQNRIPHLIGKDNSISTISSWMKGKSSQSSVEVLTICRMAGIGKTTLTKYIYLLHRHEFERSSFVEDIERRSCAQQPSTLLPLQNQLLADILKKSKIEGRNVDDSKFKIEKALADKQTLIVLDGVDDSDQVDILIRKKGFHRGSKIIITTKNGSVTEKCALFQETSPPKHTKHALSGLSETKSLRLLCWHAFGGYAPKEGYEKEATRASEYCGGNPLALKVLGSSLRNKDATWSYIFEMIQTGEFHTHVRKVLQINFDSLPSENCKELFKHIACFFVENDREVTEVILKECGFHVSYGIDMLIDRCLITVDEKNMLKMHQLLQEMGRDLVLQESPEKPWERSRVCNHEESFTLLKQDKGTTKIQGLILDMRVLEKESLHELRTNALTKMDNLHILQLNHVKLKGSYKNFPQGLRGLCMHGFELKYISSGLSMEKLVALDMSYSKLKQLWKKKRV